MSCGRLRKKIPEELWVAPVKRCVLPTHIFAPTGVLLLYIQSGLPSLRKRLVWCRAVKENKDIFPARMEVKDVFTNY